VRRAVVERGRQQRHHRRPAQALDRAIGAEAEPATQLGHRTAGEPADPLLGRGQAERHQGVRDAVQLGRDRPGELIALADHEVGLPGLDDRQQIGERRAGAQAREAVADDHDVAVGLQ
jgi:hypothetical protein